MSKKDRIAFIIYFLSALGSITFGIAYLSCSTIMPYHQEAINTSWEELSTGLQVLLEALVKLVAAGFFVTGLSMLILLLIPFRRGEKWAHWAIPIVGIVWSGFSLYVSATVAIKTHASTPWPASIAGIIMIVAAFILSPGLGKNHRAVKN